MATKQRADLKLNTTMKVKVEQGGRIVIPAEFRKQLEIKSGDTILIRLSEEDTLLIRTYPAVTKRIQEFFRAGIEPGRSLVDELIEERKAEAAREEEADRLKRERLSHL